MKFMTIDLRVAGFLSLLLALFVSAPAGAEEPAAAGKVLTMTGLKRDSVKLSAPTLIFTGLKRLSVEVGPAVTEKTNK